MRFFRTMAGVGAAALAFLALSRVNRRMCADQSTGDCLKKATVRVQGVIRRQQGTAEYSVTDDVI